MRQDKRLRGTILKPNEAKSTLQHVKTIENNQIKSESEMQVRLPGVFPNGVFWNHGLRESLCV